MPELTFDVVKPFQAIIARVAKETAEAERGAAEGGERRRRVRRVPKVGGLRAEARRLLRALDLGLPIKGVLVLLKDRVGQV